MTKVQAEIKKTVTFTVKKDEVAKVLKQAMGVPDAAKVSFKLKEVSTDPMGRYSHKEFAEAEITYNED